MNNQSSQSAKLCLAQSAPLCFQSPMDKKIKKLLVRYTVKELAGFLGVSPRTVQGWKYGRRPTPFLSAQIKELR